MTRGIWGDPERYLETYWSRFPGVWTHGDWASVDDDGYWFLHGRSDDTLNVAGKRIGPAELESAAVGHPAVAEAAAIGVPHEVKGEVPWLFCVLLPGRRDERGGGRACRHRRARQVVQARARYCSSPPCRRHAARRSCGAPSARRRSGRTPATSRRSRTRSRSRRSRVPSDRLDGVALVTGGGRGIGASDRARARGRRHEGRRHRPHAGAGGGRRRRDRRPGARRRRLAARRTSRSG